MVSLVTVACVCCLEFLVETTKGRGHREISDYLVGGIRVHAPPYTLARPCSHQSTPLNSHSAVSPLSGAGVSERWPGLGEGEGGYPQTDLAPLHTTGCP
ncbi:hypothetical protein DPEC_G00185800 [Dallia pectoralis]|uniref:Uncharacterized protein n=1 Tax=Dallia pectoralis TaxID=75939 RepID=A0ACC2GBE5_DALPE|nr:hypothetical protein DPEC_G00185800 [Dallia pectoralis]